MATSEELDNPPPPDPVNQVESGEQDDVGDGAAIEAPPLQFGYMRFVYAAYMGAAILVAFVIAKAGHAAWYRLSQWRPSFGEPKDEVVYLAASLFGVIVSVALWRSDASRHYAIDVAEEFSKVSWPSRKEVSNSTTVVLFYTLFATVFFTLMDQFWKFVTDRIYSF